jgi:hypothetical protein
MPPLYTFSAVVAGIATGAILLMVRSYMSLQSNAAAIINANLTSVSTRTSVAPPDDDVFLVERFDGVQWLVEV